MQRLKHKVTVVDNSALARRIGKRLRESRLRAGLTQRQLADGRYTAAYISALERGLAKPSIAALSFIAERVGVPAEHFVAEEPDLRPLRLEADIALASSDHRRAIDLYTELLDRQLDPLSLAEVKVGLAEALCRVDRGGEAIVLASDAAQTFTAGGRTAQAALARYWLAYGHYHEDNLDQARSTLSDLLQVVNAGLRVAPDFRFRLLTAMANIESRQGEDERALAYLHEAEALTDQLDLRKRGVFLAGLAISYREAGDYEASITAGLQSLALHRAARATLDQAGLSNNLALTYLRLGNLARADELASSAAILAAAEGEQRLLAHIRETQAQIALARGDLVAARQLATDAEALANTTSNTIAEASAAQTLAKIANSEGNPEAALAACRRAVDLLRRVRMPARLRDALGDLAALLTEQGELTEANRLYVEALRVGH